MCNKEEREIEKNRELKEYLERQKRAKRGRNHVNYERYVKKGRIEKEWKDLEKGKDIIIY